MLKNWKHCPIWKAPIWSLFREVLSQAETQVDAWGGQLYFVYLSDMGTISGYSSWGKTKRGSVLTMVENLGIPIVDIDPAFQASGDPLSLFPFRGAGHYNETGHRLVAQEVLKAISRPRTVTVGGRIQVELLGG